MVGSSLSGPMGSRNGDSVACSAGLFLDLVPNELENGLKPSLVGHSTSVKGWAKQRKLCQFDDSFLRVGKDNILPKKSLNC